MRAFWIPPTHSCSTTRQEKGLGKDTSLDAKYVLGQTQTVISKLAVFASRPKHVA